MNTSEEIDGTRLLLVGSEPEMLELFADVLAESGFHVELVDILENVASRMDGHALEVVVCDEVEGDYGGE